MRAWRAQCAPFLGQLFRRFLVRHRRERAMTSKAVVIGGFGATISVEDVLHVASGTPCCLDAELADKLDRESAANKTLQQVRNDRKSRDSCQARSHTSHWN